MRTWLVHVGCGWEDRIPEEVERTIQTFDTRQQLALICLNAQCPAPAPPVIYGSCIDRHSAAIDVAGMMVGMVGKLLEFLARDDIEALSLMFANFQPDRFELTDPSNTAELSTSSVTDGLRSFCEGVEGSLHPNRIWSTCEWVALTCTRPDESGITQIGEFAK